MDKLKAWYICIFISTNNSTFDDCMVYCIFVVSYSYSKLTILISTSDEDGLKMCFISL